MICRANAVYFLKKKTFLKDPPGKDEKQSALQFWRRV